MSGIPAADAMSSTARVSSEERRAAFDSTFPTSRAPLLQRWAPASHARNGSAGLWDHDDISRTGL